MQLQLIIRHKSLIFYGICMALLLFFLKWLELRFIIISYSLEIYIAAIALVFTLLGIWLALKLAKPKTITVEKEIYISGGTPAEIDEKTIEKLGLSRREIEVLQLMSEGLSNQEIGERLFLSLNTIKTHSSNVFDKLDVKRRTQAVEKAKRLRIIG
jgi:two-component system, NarL family, response regulator LiaR